MDERENVIINLLKEKDENGEDIDPIIPLVSPHIVTITVAAREENMGKLLKRENIGGYVCFSYGQKEYKGFIMQTKEYPADRKEQEVTLILHPDTPFNFKEKDNLAFLSY